MKALKFIVLGLAASLLGGCSKSYPEPENVHVADVYSLMARYGRADSLERAAMVAPDSVEVHAFMSVVGELPVTDARMQAWSWSLPVLRFTPLVDSILPDGVHDTEVALGTILARARQQGIPLADRRYAAVVWGRFESVGFVDSVMLIALNHYLGAEHEAYDDFPLYMRLVKEPHLLPYDLAEALIASDYPYRNEGGTALQRMLYEGALVKAKIATVDGGNLQDALAYRPEQMQFLRDEEANLWRTLVAQNYLFDTNIATIDKLVLPAPNTPLLDRRSPGRAGRYIGYRIVEKYASKHPEASLAFLLSPEFYTDPDVLAQSGYNP